MGNWVVVDPKRGIYIDMDIVGAIGTYEQKQADDDNWCVGFFSREGVENEIACGRYATKEEALDCARIAFITTLPHEAHIKSESMPLLEMKYEDPLVKEFANYGKT